MTDPADPADPAPRRGLMLIVSSPSGAGKTTLTRLLLEEDRGIELSISVTTRPKRASEIDGRHYHFISQKRFHALKDADELLEWAEVHGNFYGTLRVAPELIGFPAAKARTLEHGVIKHGSQVVEDGLRLRRAAGALLDRG